jgi:hypothetical protein
VRTLLPLALPLLLLPGVPGLLLLLPIGDQPLLLVPSARVPGGGLTPLLLLNGTLLLPAAAALR